MIIKGIEKAIRNYVLEKGIDIKDIAANLNISEGTLFSILKTENVVKTEIFIKLFKLLDLSFEEFINSESETMTQINNVLAPNHGTIQNIATVESRHELELIIEYQKKEISRLEDALRRADEMIELLKKR